MPYSRVPQRPTQEELGQAPSVVAPVKDSGYPLKRRLGKLQRYKKNGLNKMPNLESLLACWLTVVDPLALRVLELQIEVLEVKC